uniref:3'-5' exonuclease domain-containing protein n=1 Tax=Oryza barthii TaxID=65489 RepID=A0A0D3HJR8_9ORYZ
MGLTPQTVGSSKFRKVRLGFQEGRFVQFGFYLRYARYKRIEKGLLFSAQFQICRVSPKSSSTPMAGRYYTPPTPRPPPENMLDVFMDGDAVAIRATITSSHYLTAQFVNKIAHEHHEGGGLIVGIDTEWCEDHEPDIVYHLSLLLDSQAEWARKCTTWLSPRGGPNTSNCRLLQILKSDYNSKKAGRYYTPPTHRPPPENTLDVFMDGDAVAIRTTITLSHCLATQFINEIALGIDTEWREDHEPDDKKCYKVAVLQLFLNRRCLVFQLYQASNEVPRELAEFLADAGVRFVGVGVDGGVRRLANECNLRVACTVDLRDAAVAVLSRPELARAGLKSLALIVMGTRMEKAKDITMSRWGEPTLTWKQVNSTCIDVYMSYEIGRRMLSDEPILAAPS